MGPEGGSQQGVEDVRGHLAQMIEQGRSKDALDLVTELLEKLKDENRRLGLELFKLMKRESDPPCYAPRP